ncbi:hypothetical protein PG985_002470 [Apiospora marii]|uniref:DUF6604 domain-containing protein n=1 Tax=Apiospora marii TaxID=335849 RepID=A0ABR1RSZ6_9PEZI
MSKLYGSLLYQEYAQKTEVVAKWLKDTAKGLGYEAKHGALQPQTGHKRVYTLNSADYIRAAEFIAESDPSFEVPSHVITALDEAIQYRQRAQDNHAHFINILKDVWWVFQKRANKGNIWVM